MLFILCVTIQNQWNILALEMFKHLTRVVLCLEEQVRVTIKDSLAGFVVNTPRGTARRTTLTGTWPFGWCRSLQSSENGVLNDPLPMTYDMFR